MSSSRLCVLLLSVLFASSLLVAQPPGTTIHFVNGQWFDGTGFVPMDLYAERGVFAKKPSSKKKIQVVDLRGGFVVPPYGDAHEHNFDGLRGIGALTATYLRDGIFYAQGMTDTTDGANDVLAAKLVDTPQTVDVTYAHGGLTGVNGHPKEVYEPLALGIYTGYTKEQEPLIIASHQQEGHAYWEIADAAALDAKWPRILAARPDLIKIYLSDSAHFRPAMPTDSRLAKGLDPALVPLIVAKAHAAGLKVAAHIETAADYHVAITGGVDEMGHLCDYGLLATDDASLDRIADADIALSAERHIAVQPTAGIRTDESTPAADRAARRASQIDNIGRLKKAGVRILVASDYYGRDSLHEADYLQSLGLWTNTEMLRMWAVTTPQAIFPKRKLGVLKPGYEASFLVLSADPLAGWPAVHAIVDRWKRGEHLVLAPTAAK